MTSVIINDNSRTERKLLSNSETYPRVEKTIDKETFDEDCRYALTPEQFMLEMEQRIMKW
jgi:hypothetical protein